MMVSWRQLLQRMYEFTTEEPGVQSDIHQLQGVVEFMDAFEPIGEEELSSRFPRRMLSLVRLVDDALDLGQQQQWILLKRTGQALATTGALNGSCGSPMPVLPVGLASIMSYGRGGTAWILLCGFNWTV